MKKVFAGEIAAAVGLKDTITTDTLCDENSPIALDRTRGAFYKGLRLMAIDGVSFDIPDTPPNAKAFGRPVTRRYGSAIGGSTAGIRRFT